ncbi:hypothetical protein BJ742DRAFT_895241 [Cladochytrium replicatum]|nr:hypothetical protein BJ742DRAFT_895241 [Cladochytrium replicatum]
MKDLAAAYALARDEDGYKMWRLEQQDRAARALELEEDPLAANLCIGACAGWTDIGAQEIFAFPNAFADVGRAVVAVTSSVYARGFDSIVGMVTLFVVNTQERLVNKFMVIPEGVDDRWSTEDEEVMDSMPGIVDELCVDNEMKFIYTFEQKTLADGTDLAMIRKRNLENQETVATQILATGEDAHRIEINKLTIKEMEGKTVLTEETRIEQQVQKGVNLVTVQTNWVWDIDTLEGIMAPTLPAHDEEGGEEEKTAEEETQEEAGEDEEGDEEGDREYDEDAEYEEQQEGANVTSWDSARFFAADFNGRILIWENKKHTIEEIVAMAKEEAGDQEVPEEVTEYEAAGGEGLDQLVFERGEMLGQMRAHVEEAKYLQYTEVGDTKILLSVNATDLNPHIPWVLKAFDVTRYWESS